MKPLTLLLALLSALFVKLLNLTDTHRQVQNSFFVKMPRCYASRGIQQQVRKVFICIGHHLIPSHLVTSLLEAVRANQDHCEARCA